MYTAVDELSYLTTRRKRDMMDMESYGKPEHVRISVSPFRQSANYGYNLNGDRVELGDINGRWNILGLFYPDKLRSTGETVTTFGSNLLTLVGINPNSVTCFQTTTTDSVIIPRNVDKEREFGFFNVPMTYRKQGARFEVEFGGWAGFGIRIQTGIADLCQTATFVDLTCQSADNSCVSSCTIQAFDCWCKKYTIDNVMAQFETLIAPALGYSTAPYHVTSMEDFRISLFWRTLNENNFETQPAWAPFVFMPYFSIDGLLSGLGSCPRNYSQLFSLSTDCDGFNAIGLTAGFTVDWVDTVQIGIKMSGLAFDCQTKYGVPVPTNEFQSGVYPITADLNIKPGSNWSFEATLTCYQFLERLSFYGQYVMVHHSPDCITLNTECSTPLYAILLDKLERESQWTSQLANFSLWYDISPSVELGFLVQLPIVQNAAYRSTTILGTIALTF